MDDLAISYAENGGYPVDHSEKPVRLFESNFLEFFTHITPLAIVILWVPVIIFLFAISLVHNEAVGFPWFIPAGILSGLFLWTLVEYTLHRFLFHFHPKGALGKRLIFLFHGIHHYQPQCKTRLVMPPAASLPMALILYGLLYVILGLLFGRPQWVNPLTVGLLIGYLFYDLTHYATHHFAMHSGVWRFLKRYHMKHHFKSPNMRYGVSSPLWDVVFKTMPKD